MNAGRVMGKRIGMAAFVAVLVCAQAAAADPAERDIRFESVTRTIDLTGLDVTSQAGAQRLYREIANTAQRICWGTSRAQKGVARVKQQHDQARRCFDDAVDGALAQVAEKTGVDLEQVAGSDRFDYAGLVAWR